MRQLLASLAHDAHVDQAVRPPLLQLHAHQALLVQAQLRRLQSTANAHTALTAGIQMLQACIIQDPQGSPARNPYADNVQQDQGYDLAMLKCLAWRYQHVCRRDR
jgi:hypothetical protein